MVEQVIYRLGMEDTLTPGVLRANSAVNSLESSLGTIKGLVAGLGAGFAIFGAVEFVSAGREEFHKLEQAVAQVKAGLESTGGIAGVTFADMEEQAGRLAHTMRYSKAEITDMQSQLLTFPDITKEIFERSETTIADIATKTHHGLSETAIMFGKALGGGEAGINKLVRYGVIFTEQQKENLKHLFETNKALEAQKLMLDYISQSGYGGAAVAAAAADPNFKMAKATEELKLQLGEAAQKLLTQLTPAILKFIEVVKDAVEWVRTNWQMLKEMAIAAGIAFAAFKIGSVVLASYTAYMEGAAVATEAAVVAEGELAVTTTAALGPLGLLAAAVWAIAYAWQATEDAERQAEELQAKHLNTVYSHEKEGITNDVQAYQKKYNVSDKKAFTEVTGAENNLLVTQITENATKLQDANKAYNDIYEKVKSGKSSSYSAIKTAKNELDNLQDRQTDLLEQKRALDDIQKNGLIKKADAPKTTAEGGGKTKEPTNKATGSKSVTINVTIQKLGETTINTTNLKDGVDKIKDKVVAVLTGAINDFQVIADK